MKENQEPIKFDLMGSWENSVSAFQEIRYKRSVAFTSFFAVSFFGMVCLRLLVDHRLHGLKKPSTIRLIDLLPTLGTALKQLVWQVREGLGHTLSFSLKSKLFSVCFFFQASLTICY